MSPQVYKAIKGFHDSLPTEAALRAKVEKVSSDTASRYGFREIRVPVMEKLPLFVHSIGEDTDIVGKEMYTLDGGSAGQIALRPEGTAGVVRAYIENRLDTQADGGRLFYIGPMFRRERPQKGRLRQFHQFGVEAIGMPGPLVDAEVIALFYDILTDLKAGPLEIQINSLGSPDCRPQYRDALVEFLGAIDKAALCDNCVRRRTTNPLRALDCKVPTCQEHYGHAPKMLDYLDDESQGHWDELRQYLEDLSIPFTIVPTLVRGLDYYSHTAFEIIGGGDLGAQNTLAAGGRYNGLIEILGGKPTPAVGGAMGIERVLLAMSGDATATANDKPLIFAVVLDNDDHSVRARALPLIAKLRSAELAVVVDDAGAKMKSQMKQADKLGATHTLIFGEEEARNNIIILRDMKTSKQYEIPFTNSSMTMLEITRQLSETFNNNS